MKINKSFKKEIVEQILFLSMEELRTPQVLTQEGPNGRIWLMKNGNYQLIEDKTTCRGTAMVNSIQIHSVELHSDPHWLLLLCLLRTGGFGT